MPSCAWTHRSHAHDPPKFPKKKKLVTSRQSSSFSNTSLALKYTLKGVMIWVLWERETGGNGDNQHGVRPEAPLVAAVRLAHTSSAQPAVVKNDIVTYVRVTMGSCMFSQGSG